MKRLVRREDDFVYGMANLYPKRTGLSVCIWVDDLGANRNVKHNLPRVKVQNVPGDKVVNDTFSLSLEEHPRVLSGKVKLNRKTFNEVVQYVQSHLSDFLAAWYQDIDEDNLKERLYKK